jgi:hypothetical protein
MTPQTLALGDNGVACSREHATCIPLSIARLRWPAKWTGGFDETFFTIKTAMPFRGCGSHGPMRSDLHALDVAFERHYRLAELAEMWKLGRETVRLLVKDKPGVIKVRFGRKKAHTTYSIPASVAERIHTRLLNPPTCPR